MHSYRLYKVTSRCLLYLAYDPELGDVRAFPQTPYGEFRKGELTVFAAGGTSTGRLSSEALHISQVPNPVTVPEAAVYRAPLTVDSINYEALSEYGFIASVPGASLSYDAIKTHMEGYARGCTPTLIHIDSMPYVGVDPGNSDSTMVSHIKDTQIVDVQQVPNSFSMEAFTEACNAKIAEHFRLDIVDEVSPMRKYQLDAVSKAKDLGVVEMKVDADLGKSVHNVSEDKDE